MFLKLCERVRKMSSFLIAMRLQAALRQNAKGLKFFGHAHRAWASKLALNRLFHGRLYSRP